MDILKNAQRYATEHTKYIEPKGKKIYYWVSIKDAYMRGAKDQQAENADIVKLKAELSFYRIAFFTLAFFISIFLIFAS